MEGGGQDEEAVQGGIESQCGVRFVGVGDGQTGGGMCQERENDAGRIAVVDELIFCTRAEDMEVGIDVGGFPCEGQVADMGVLEVYGGEDGMEQL